MSYGFDGNLSAIDWLAELGSAGIANLRETDKKKLQDSGILSEDGSILQDQLTLALNTKFREVRNHVN